jgi:predicted MFS family arabinose efflux permease
MLLFLIMVFYMLTYMPTWSLTNTIAMAHSPAEKLPQIRVFGSIGWFASGAFTWVAINMIGMKDGIDGTNIPLICAGVTCLVGAAVAMTLPDTPPPAKGKPASVIDALGLRAVTLLKDKNFAFFIFISILVMFPFALYWSFLGSFLTAKGFGHVQTVMGNWGQFAEMFLMLLVPVAIAKVGIKWTMALGLLALLVRFAAFSMGEAFGGDIWIFAGILVPGLICGFFFVGGQIYVDKKAPEEIRGQAQGFIFLITFGVGLVIGTFTFGKLLELYSWATVMQIATAISAVGLVLFMLIFKNDFGGSHVEAATEAAIEEAPAADEVAADDAE